MNKDTAIIRRDAVINSAVEQVRSLLETHFKDIERAADQSFVGDDEKSEPVAKARLAIAWDALSTSPSVGVKIGWSVAYKDESEQEVDPFQQKLGIEAEGGAR